MSPSTFFAHPHQAFTAGFYKSDWDFEVRIALGLSAHGGAEPGEVLAAIAGISDGDHQKWFDEWVAVGRRVMAIADSSAAAGRRQSAASAYLRAANYLAVAVNAVDGLKSQDPLLPTFRAHRTAWDGFVRNAPYPVQTVDIPYEGTTLPGFFFSPDNDSAARPTLIMINGSDGAISSLWSSGAAGALARGYNVLLFDGPGQQTMLFERNIPFRFDWEAVTTPVVDFLSHPQRCRPGEDRAVRDQPGRLLGAALARLRTPHRRRHRRPRRGRRVHLLDRPPAREHAGAVARRSAREVRQGNGFGHEDARSVRRRRGHSAPGPTTRRATTTR